MAGFFGGGGKDKPSSQPPRTRTQAGGTVLSLDEGQVGRGRRGDSPTTGTAQPRIGADDAPAAPDALSMSRDASASALAAAIRARRKGAGASALTGLSAGTGIPGVRLNRRTLMGV